MELANETERRYIRKRLKSCATSAPGCREHGAMPLPAERSDVLGLRGMVSVDLGRG